MIGAQASRTMTVSLTPQLETYLKKKVEKGAYSSASEVVREALQLLEERDMLREQKLDVLRADLSQGIASLDAGKRKSLDIEAIKSEGRKRLANT